MCVCASLILQNFVVETIPYCGIHAGLFVTPGHLQPLPGATAMSSSPSVTGVDCGGSAVAVLHRQVMAPNLHPLGPWQLRPWDVDLVSSMSLYGSVRSGFTTSMDCAVNKE